MIFRAAILSALLAVASAQSCSVCGDGMRVPEDAKDELFSFPGQPTVPCGVLEQAGLLGQVPLQSCPFLPALIGVCNCEEGAIQPPTAPTLSPVAPTPQPVEPTLAPVSPTAAPVPPIPVGCPDVPTSGCSVCGDGLCVGNPNAIFSFPEQPSVTCAQLQDAGYEGQVPIDQCPFLPGLVAACGCGIGPDPTPTPAPVEPTPAPVPAPTPAPIEPTVDPTLAPVTAAPIAPVAPTPFPVFVLTPAPIEPTGAPVPTDGGGGKDKGKMGMGKNKDKDSGDSMGMGGSMMMGKSGRSLTAEGIPAASAVRGVN